MSAAAFAALPSDDTFAIGPGGVLTVRGNIVATGAAGSTSDIQTLRVPYIFVPRGRSNVVAGRPAEFSKVGGERDTFSSSLTLSNNGIHSGTADLYTWGIHDPRESGQPMDVRDVGVQVFPGADFGSTVDDRGLVFVINTWDRATNQTVNEFDILIDNDGDGVADFAVVGIDIGKVTTGAFDGRMGSFTIEVSTGNIVDAFFADAPMNGTIIELPTLASDLGLSQKTNPPAKHSGHAREKFSYSVNAFSIVPGTFVDTTGSATFTPFDPAVSSGDFATLAPGASTTIPLTIDKEQQHKTHALGWLIVSVDDASGAPQAAEIRAPRKLEGD
jgi:minor extracellular serine protease Vpr